ncbi:MAG: hypothetical protein ACRCZB_05450 [Bacteroidales bacterium]
MVVSKGSKVVISHLPSKENSSITGCLAEDFVLNMSSSFTQLIDSGGHKALTVLGGALSTATGGTLGGSGQIKQAGFQIWERTDPITISLQLEFHRKVNASKELRSIVQTLLSLPLPAEKLGGILVPPGPSIIEALGIEPTAKGADSYVNLTIGGIDLPRCLMTGAEPSYSKYQDESGYPIFVRVACSFKTMYSGTKSMVKSL